MTIKEALAKLHNKYPDSRNAIDMEVWDHNRGDGSLDVEFSVWIGELGQSFCGPTLASAVAIACEESGLLDEAESLAKEVDNA